MFEKSLVSANDSNFHIRAGLARLSTETEQRRHRILDSQDIQGTNHVVNGSSLIVGIGEALIDVFFPVSFTRIPSFSFGGELSAESVAGAGQFPTLSAVVSQWVFDDPDKDLFGASMRRYFKGARLACVVTGPGTQKLLLHWTFSGMALTNPGPGTFIVPLTGQEGRVIT